jgi:hypothetical protein
MNYEGTYWDDRELCYLKMSFELGVPADVVSKKLKRNSRICKRKFRELKRYDKFFKPWRV